MNYIVIRNKKICKHRIASCIIVLLAFVVSSCSHVEITLYRDPYPPTKGRGPLDNLRTYITKRPEKEYHEIAQIVCESDNHKKNKKLLQNAAKKLGADAVIIVGKMDSSTVIGIAIRYGSSPVNKEYMRWSAD